MADCLPHPYLGPRPPEVVRGESGASEQSGARGRSGSRTNGVCPA